MNGWVSEDGGTEFIPECGCDEPSYSSSNDPEDEGHYAMTTCY